MIKLNSLIRVLIVSIIFIPANSLGQDTIRIKGHLRESFLLESIELYPDRTFKWRNEYDLNYNEYGEFEIKNDSLILDFYIFMWEPTSMSIRDSIALVPAKSERRIFEIEGKRLYPLTHKGKRIIRMKDPYWRRKWGWLIGNRYEYKVIADKKL